MRQASVRFRGAPLLSLLSSAIAIALLIWIGSLINWDYIETLDFRAVYPYRVALLEGLGNTLALTFLSMSVGLVLGFTLAILLQLPVAPLQWLIWGYIEVLRNTPLVFQLFWIHFALPQISGLSTSAFQSGCIALTLQASAYLADLARSGIQAVPKGQWEAGDALGLGTWSKWIEIILPQAIKIIIPPLANLALGYFKTSAALALLSVGELMTVGARVATFSFRPIETYTIVGLIYLVCSYLLSAATFRLEKVFKHPRI